MQDVKQRVKELAEEFGQFLKSFNLEKKKGNLMVLEGKTTDPDLWSSPDGAKKVLQEYSDLKKEIEEAISLQEEISIIQSLVDGGDESKEIEAEVGKAEKVMEKLNLTTFLSGPYDAKNTLVSIHAGQGGVEAMDWVSMLLRMYLRFCEKRGWETQVLDSTSGEEAGIKSVTFLVSGNYAYGYLKGEAGTHRLVRQSPFNADKLRETSFALVEVLPELAETDLPDIEIKDDEIETQFFHSSSQGGQNVQKVSTAVRITHKLTGIVVTAQSERFQEQNRKNALNLLRAKLWAKKQADEEKTKQSIKGDYKPASWGNQIRSYVLHPYKMIKDLRTEVETGNCEAVLDGEIEEFIAAELKIAR